MSNAAVTASGIVAPADEAFGSSLYADLVGARLLDFFQATSPWQRRLWDVGTCLVLDELIEATEWRARRVLSDGAVAWLAKDAERIAGRDPAIGEAAFRNTSRRRSAVRSRMEPDMSVAFGSCLRWRPPATSTDG